MVDVALVELEGVVFETRDLRVGALRDAFATQGIACPVHNEAMTGLAPRAAAAAALAAAKIPADHVLVDLIALTAERAFSSRLGLFGARLSRGGRGFLEHAASSARIGIVTRAARADVDALIRLSGLDVPFAVVVCGDDVLDGKPAVDGYRVALDRLSRSRPVNTSSVLALEDAGDGIRAARSAKVRCVAVGDVPPHVAIEADAFVASLEGHTLASLDQLSRPGRERVQ
jgi:beta-phosphoglucomutase-like phosphatase (HAD superfamily)